jgi:hypothetical protein
VRLGGVDRLDSDAVATVVAFSDVSGTDDGAAAEAVPVAVAVGARTVAAAPAEAVPGGLSPALPFARTKASIWALNAEEDSEHEPRTGQSRSEGSVT